MRMRGAWHVARMRDIINIYINLVGKSEVRFHFRDLDIDGRTVINFDLKETLCEDED
jgi:hypothetical protein